LFSAIPKLTGEKEIQGIKGSVPDYLDPPSGCRFHPRCKRKLKICSIKKPELIEVEDSHFVACHLFEKGR
jgi:peptide/nickel transport system ATP-binding protein